jgi:hypothetical protein
MRLSVLKPQQAKWLIDCHARMSHQEEVIKDGWVKSGLASVMNQENKVVMAANECPCVPTNSKVEAKQKVTDAIHNFGQPSKVTGPTGLSFSKIMLRQGEGTEYFLPGNLSQSAIDRRNGSNACTVISALIW